MSDQDNTSPASATQDTSTTQPVSPETNNANSACISVPQASLCAAVSSDITESQTESIGPEPTIYNRIFWWAYIANLVLVSANAMTFRFAELINLLGGTQQLAGMIVSIGVISALVGRLFLGQWIDRFGVRPLWLITSVIMIVGVLMLVVPASLGWSMYLGRSLFVFGIGGMFACSITHIQNHVPAHRRTEVIGSLGSSGFLGMIVGSQLGDIILTNTSDNILRYWILFGIAALFAFVYLLIVCWITRKDVHTAHHESQSALPLLIKYWPGGVMLVAVMMGMGFTSTTVFLTRYATSMGLRGVGTYFTAYAVTAFFIRVMTRHTSKIYGRHRMIIVGMSGHIIGHFWLCFVTQEWHFILPAMCSGFAHALLFPCVVSLGTETFPNQYRGTGTTLLLCFLDLGGLLSAPLLGSIIDHVSFPAMFAVTALCYLMVTLFYTMTTGRKIDPEMLHHASRSKKN
ncbi:MAG: MFS transporter [Planctomycetaceae bacterium]|nr:MFS transporter [Planctomycetaceae bacterium]